MPEYSPLHPKSFEIVQQYFKSKSTTQSIANSTTQSMKTFFESRKTLDKLLLESTKSEAGHLEEFEAKEDIFKDSTIENQVFIKGLKKEYFKLGLLFYHCLCLKIFENTKNDGNADEFDNFLNDLKDAQAKIDSNKVKIIELLAKGQEGDGSNPKLEPCQIIFLNEITKDDAKPLKKYGHVYFSDLEDSKNLSAIYIKSGNHLSYPYRSSSVSVLDFYSTTDMLKKKKYIEQIVINYGKDVKDICYLHVDGIHCFCIHFNSEDVERKSSMEDRKKDVVEFIKNLVKSMPEGSNAKYIISIDTNSTLFKGKKDFGESELKNTTIFPELPNDFVGQITLDKNNNKTIINYNENKEIPTVNKKDYLHKLNIPKVESKI